MAEGSTPNKYQQFSPGSIIAYHWGWFIRDLPSGKRLHSYGKSPFLMGNSTISMAIFNSFLYVYQRVIVCFYSVESCKIRKMCFSLF